MSFSVRFLYKTRVLVPYCRLRAEPNCGELNACRYFEQAMDWFACRLTHEGKSAVQIGNDISAPPIVERLVELAGIAAAPPGTASIQDVDAACRVVRDALGADEAYIVRAGDPYFLRLGSDEDPTAYELKQKGYFLIWRELAANPHMLGLSVQAVDRIVLSTEPICVGQRPTHLATILQGDESNSELLVVRGRWPDGLTSEHLALGTISRPILASLVSNVLDAQRQSRRRHQLGLLAEVASAFSQPRRMDSVLVGIATAMAKALGFDWVIIYLFDEALEQIVESGGNFARFSDTETALQFRAVDGDNNWQSQLVKHLRRLGRPILVPDVFTSVPGFSVSPEFTAYYERAHILSTAIFPIRVQDRVIGMTTFSSSRRRVFDPDEVSLLNAVVSQAEVSIGGLRLQDELRRANALLEQLATHDVLTGLPNRALCADRLTAALTGAGSGSSFGAVLLLDLDEFKRVNDSLGHEAGDSALKLVGERLRASLTTDTATVARLGGDEFALILPQTRLTDAWTITQQILAAVREPMQVGQTRLSITGSIGISLFPEEGTDAATLMRHADLAMYEAKAAGRNGCRVYARAMGVHAVSRLGWENRLRKALENSELEVYYQPQVDVQSDRVVAMEALARWPQPNGRFVPPGVFIPQAEEAGLIGLLGAQVLRTACMQASSWRDLGLGNVRVAVIVSAQQLHDGVEFVALVTRTLQDAGLAPEDLELEITEQVLLKDESVAVKTLSRLRHLGVMLAVDDFGTGYSSLVHLREQLATTLKIDRSFIRELTQNPRDQVIVSAMTSMARGLGLRVVAGGVETAQQRDHLRELGCDSVQGYLCSEPVSATEATALLIKNRGLASETRERRRG